MAGYLYIDLVTDAEEITQVRSIRSVVKRLANQSQAHIAALAEWPFLWTESFFQTIAEYATGTLALTNGSATITGTDTVFTSAMVGRKLRVSGDTASYTIKTFTSTTSITLDQTYGGTTASGVSYSIYKDQYLLRADVDTQKRLRQAENGVALFSLSAGEFDERYPSPTGTGTPSLDVFSGKAVKTYATGTVSISSSSRTLTGSSTAWTGVEGLGRGTKLKIGTLIFTVNTVDSDTQITVYEIATSTVTSSAYTAILDNYVVQLHAIPIIVQTYYYRFQRIPAVLDADNDIPELPSPMHPLILLDMLPFLWRHKGFIDRAIEAQNAFDKELERWMAKYQQPVLDRSYPLHPQSMYQMPDRARLSGNIGVPFLR